jgi:cytochrome c553
MGKYRGVVAACLLMAAAAGAEEAKFQGDPARGKRIFDETCAACHGPAGVSEGAAIPNLAGQIPDYLAKQLHAFRPAEGQKPKRPNETMTPIAETLSGDDIAGLAAYLSSLPPATGDVSSAPQAALGRSIYWNGNPQENLPACVTCHRPDGGGLRPDFPRLAGQKADYVEGQLASWMAVRGKPGKLMSLIVPLMQPTEKRAVADYVATLGRGAPE